MLFKGTIGQQLSGSIGGIVASHNSGGTYFRARTTPTNPSTNPQLEVRQLMSQLSNDWVNTLTQAQRDLWAAYAENVPVINKVGDTIFITGMNHYIRSNLPRAQAAFAILNLAPTIFDKGSFTPTTAVADASADTVSVAFDANDVWANAGGGGLFIYASVQQNPTINFFRGPYRLLGTIIGDSVTPPTSPVILAYTLGVLTQANRLFLRLQATQEDGRLSASEFYMVTIIA